MKSFSGTRVGWATPSRKESDANCTIDEKAPSSLGYAAQNLFSRVPYSQPSTDLKIYYSITAAAGN